jgi:WD40 repeat protein
VATRTLRIEALFHAALELEGEERRRYLAAACADDEGLRQEVEALLALDREPDAGLDAPAPAALELGEAPANLLVGRRLGPYALRRCLAVGGMGVVYEAEQDEPQRTVAVKVLRTDVASSDLVLRFRVEAGFLARLQHQAIAHVYGADVAELDGRRVPYIAMELVEGARTITAFAREEALSIPARVELFLQVCAAVHHGHQRGIIHRDLKPANILVDRTGAPKLIDFGVARAVDPEGATRRTQAGVFLGTVQYTSPEQCADARDLDVRSDVYSLGVLLYELLCERLPYDLEDVPLPQAARIVQEQPPRRPSTSARSLRGDLETILLKALEKDRARRYQSADELGSDLRCYLRREPIAAHAPGVVHRSALFARRHKAWVGSLATLFATAVVAVVVSTSFALRERRARQREELQSTLANLAAADANLREHDIAGARARLARIPAVRRGWEWAHLAGRLDDSERRFVGPSTNCEDVGWREGRLVSAWRTPTGARVVSWDVASGAEFVRHVSLAPEDAPQIEILSDGSLVWGANDGRLALWRPGSPAADVFAGSHARSITAVRRSADDRIVTASVDGTVRTWDCAALCEQAILMTGTVAWSDMDLDLAGERVALAGEDGTVRVLALAGDREPIVLSGHERPVLAVAFHPDGRHLASGSRDSTVRIWDLDRECELRRLVGHQGDVRAVAFLAQGAELVSGSFDRTLRVWDFETGVARRVLHGHEHWISSLAVSPDGDRIATGAYDGSVRVWDPELTRVGDPIRDHAAIVRDVAFSPDGRLLASASFDGTVRLVEISTRRTAAVIGGHGARVMAVAFHPSGDLVATASNDHRVRLWDAAEGRLIAALTPHRDGVHALAFSQDGRLLATGSKDGRALVLDAQSLETRHTLEHGAWVDDLAVDPTSRRLATVANDGILRTWDVDAGAELWQQRAERPQSTLAYSPDGGTIATAVGAGRIALWEAEDGELRAILSGHSGSVWGLAFSPDGERLASVGDDASVRIWDRESGVEMLVLRGHESWIWGVAFSPDGSLLASCGGTYDGTGVGVRLWSAR